MYLACGPRLKMRTSQQRDRAPWTLAASVHQAGIDYGAWSRHRGNPHAYPPFWHSSWILDTREFTRTDQADRYVELRTDGFFASGDRWHAWSAPLDTEGIRISPQ